MAFQSCFTCLEHSCTFLRLLPPLYHSQKLVIPSNAMGALRNFSTQYISILNHHFPQLSQRRHYRSANSKLVNLKAEFDQVREQAVKDTHALCRFSDRFYIMKLLAKITAILFTVGVLNLVYYFQNTFPTSPPPAPLAILFGSRKWTVSKEKDLSFDDVIGCDEAIQELQNIVQFLRSPNALEHIGARLPRNVLLIGPPGVGKTHLVRAFASESGVPVIYVNGSEVEGRYVGEGAQSIRELFSLAHSKSPCIIFIDAIDSLQSRHLSDSGFGSASQTLNQLLVEMDGFSKDSKKKTGCVMVIAATHDPGRLDPALLRSGRFDMQLTLRLPQKMDRLKLLIHFLNKVKHKPISAPELRSFLQRTVGMTGADIANIVNYAAVTAVLEDSERVTFEHLLLSVNRVTFGSEHSLIGVDSTAKRAAAIHEAGHAIVAFLTDNAPEIFCVSLRHKSGANPHGCSCRLSDNPEDVQSRQRLLARMDVLFGGRVAEEELLGSGSVSDTAAEDLRHATFLAKKMVCHLGMASRVGFFLPVIEVDDSNSSSYLSDTLKRLAEGEVNRLLRESRSRARHCVLTHRKQLASLVDALEEFEALDAEDLSLLMSGGVPKVAMVKEAELERKISGWSNF